MRVVHVSPESFGANCYLLEDGAEALIVDPSASAASILGRIRKDNCQPIGILLTHGHFDHLLSVDALRRAEPSLPAMIHAEDAPLMTDGRKNAFTLFFGKPQAYGAPDRLLADGETLRVGRAELTILLTPGHTPGSICALCEADDVLLTGDTLFAEGVGRCDLYGGNAEALRRSLGRLSALSGSLTIYPGHGRTSTLSRALSNARFL